MLEALPWLAFEIEDIGIVFGDQHLPEMEIAVVADLAALKTGPLEAFDMREDCLALLEQSPGGRGGRGGERGALPHIEHAACACEEPIAPPRAVLRRDWLRRKPLDIVAGECAMQLGGAPANLPHALKHRSHLGCVRGNFVAQYSLLIDQAVKPGTNDAPGIALVLDKGVHGRERRTTLALDQLDRPEQCRRVAELRDVDQETADLEFRMHARRDLGQDLGQIMMF